jgi:hypothetical protein
VYTRLDYAHRAVPLVLGVATLIGVALLLAWEINPGAFPEKAHDTLAAFPLAVIAIAYLLYQTVRRPTPMEFVKALILVVAFLFWAANQFWPDRRGATFFNDMAIALFIVDVFLVMVGWPTTAPDESFAETYVDEVKRP